MANFGSPAHQAAMGNLGGMMLIAGGAMALANCWQCRVSIHAPRVRGDGAAGHALAGQIVSIHAPA